MTDFSFDHSYARLPKRFYSASEPAIAPSPKLIKVNEQLATDLGFDPSFLKSSELADFFSGNK